MLSALQVGTDRNLLKTRGGVLESVGLGVTSAASVPEAWKCIDQGSFDVAILCHSLTPGERAAVAVAVRLRNPGIPVLLVRGARDQPGPKPPGIDGVLDSQPQRLVHGLRGFLRLPGESKDVRRAPISIDTARPRPH